MADQKTRKAPTPHGFDLQLGTAEDVARIGEVGSFLGLKTKAALESAFEGWLAGQAALDGFYQSLRDLARQKLDGPTATTAPAADPAHVDALKAAVARTEPLKTADNI